MNANKTEAQAFSIAVKPTMRIIRAIRAVAEKMGVRPDFDECESLELEFSRTANRLKKRKFFIEAETLADAEATVSERVAYVEARLEELRQTTPTANARKKRKRTPPGQTPEKATSAMGPEAESSKVFMGRKTHDVWLYLKKQKTLPTYDVATCDLQISRKTYSDALKELRSSDLIPRKLKEN
jgi:hypothetical protein